MTQQYKTSVRDLSDKKRLLAVQQETEEEEEEEKEKRFVRLTANEGPFNGGRLHTTSTCFVRSACNYRASESITSQGTINFKDARYLLGENSANRHHAATPFDVFVVEPRIKFQSKSIQHIDEWFSLIHDQVRSTEIIKLIRISSLQLEIIFFF